MAGQDNNGEQTINYYRLEIDKIDTELLRLLNQRAGCAMAIGKIKKDLGLPIYVPAREDAVIKKLSERNAGPLPNPAIEELFKIIFGHMKKLEA